VKATMPQACFITQTQNLHPKPGLWEFFAYPDGVRYVGNQASTNFLPNNALQAIFGLTGQVLPWA